MFRKSRVLERLRRGQAAVGPPFAMFAMARVAEVIGRCGYDLLWVDMEHRPLDWPLVYDIGIGARASDVDMIIRVVKTGYDAPMKALEAGAHGVMIPHCMSAEEAQRWARWAKYPPLGNRGFDMTGPDADFGAIDKYEYITSVNAETFLCVQIEDPCAVDCVDQIAAVQGVDLLFIGPADLSITYGIPFQWEHKLIQDAIERTAAAAKKHGKYWGIPFINPELAKRNYARGARLFFTGYDEQDAIVEVMRKVYVDFRTTVGEKP
ncbi:MAG: aldolase/citrate lyase family protein [Planctomycetota bacterium]